MADGLDEFVINPGTGETVRLPTAYGAYMGLPQAELPPPPVPPPPSGPNSMERRDEKLHDLMAFFSPKAVEGRKAQPEYWNSPAGQARLAEMEARRADMESRNRDFQALNPGRLSPDQVADQAEFNAPKPHAPPPPGLLAQAGRILPGELSRHSNLFLAQSTGPIGTIRQIGQGDLGPAPTGEYASQAQLDQALADQQAAIPPPAQTLVDPNKPEQAGADLQRQAIGMQEKAAGINSAADQKQADAEVAALEDQKRRVEEARAETARRDAEWQKRREEIQQNVTKATDEWSKYKIDPGRRWKNASTGRKIGAAIAVAMTALGDALQRKSGPNLALQMILDGIHEDVDLQVKDREHLGDVASRARTSLDDYRKEYGDWQQARSAKLSEEYKRTAEEIELQSAKVKADRAKANALSMVADLRARAGALDNGIATSAWNREMKLADAAEQKRQARAQESQGWARIKQSGDQFDKDLKYKYDALAAEQKAAADKYTATATAEQAKALRESGIKDPTTGQYIMGGDGQPVLGRNASEAAKVQETVNGTQTMLSTIDRIKAKIANDPGFAKLNATEKQAALSSELDSLTLLIKDAYGTGALDKGSLEFTNHYTGGDPTKLTAGGLFGALGLGSDAGAKTAASLDVIAKTAETRALNQMGNPKGFKFARDEQVQETPTNKAGRGLLSGTATTAEATSEAEPGWFSKGLQDAESFVFGTKQQYKKDQEAAQEGSGNSLKYPGFRADKDAQLDQLVASAQRGDESAQKWLVDAAGNKKTQDATMTLLESQPGLQSLIPRALEKLPEDKRSMKAAIYAARAAHGPSINLYNKGPWQPQSPTSTAPYGIDPVVWQQIQDRQAILGD